MDKYTIVNANIVLRDSILENSSLSVIDGIIEASGIDVGRVLGK